MTGASRLARRRQTRAAGPSSPPPPPTNFSECRQSKDHKPEDGEYKAQLEQLGSQIESVQDFWRYNNNTPVDHIKMRESIYLFKSGFRPVWEDHRNLNGGSWTLRVPKAAGPDVWTRIQPLAIGEKLQSTLEHGSSCRLDAAPPRLTKAGDQLCGVGLSVRFSAHLITVWHRDSSKKQSIDGMLACIMDELPPELCPKPDNYFYKRHRDHAGFKTPDDAAAPPNAPPQPEVRVEPPSGG